MTRCYRIALLSALIVTIGPSVALSQLKRPLQLADMFAIKRISTPAVSPDGKWVAYTLTTPDLEANSISSDIWISSLDGAQSRQLTTHPADDQNPAWSPDGTTIAFESNRSDLTQIWLTPSLGGEDRQFTSISTGARQPVWSPDGKLLAFVSEVYPQYASKPFRESDSLNRRHLHDRKTRKVKAEVFTQLLYRHWNRWTDGRRSHIFVQPLDGGEPLDLTPIDRDAVPSSSTFSEGVDFAFSPDGNEIAFTVSPTPVREEAWSTNYDIWIVTVEGGSPRRMTTNPAADGYPRYSPDGRFIAYRAQSRPGCEADRWQILLLDRVSGDTRSLTENFDASAGSIVWSPNSKRLYFDAEEAGYKPIFGVSLTGNDVTRIVQPGTHGNVQITPDGRSLVFTRSTAVRPVDVYISSADGIGEIQVTHANDQLLSRIDIPVPESINYEGEGGTPVQAWLFKPPRFDPAHKYPLVLLVHGGPQGAWKSAWSYRWNPPLWAAQGYVIMAPNPRGSTGFGQKFTDEISGDWGGKVYQDLMRGLEYAEKLPYIDSDRCAAAGASYGGYMVNWFLGNTGTRFKTLITHSGVYNFESMYGVTDELWFDEWERGGTPWDQPDSYRTHSPHVYAKNFRTPTLVIHGANDFRVSSTEAMQLFTALQRQGVPSRFVYFPDEGHWVLKPANSAFWHETVFAWLAEYLVR